MRRDGRVTVQAPVKKQQPDGMSHRGPPSAPPSNALLGSLSVTEAVFCRRGQCTTGHTMRKGGGHIPVCPCTWPSPGVMIGGRECDGTGAPDVPLPQTWLRGARGGGGGTELCRGRGPRGRWRRGHRGGEGGIRCDGLGGVELEGRDHPLQQRGAVHVLEEHPVLQRRRVCGGEGLQHRCAMSAPALRHDHKAPRGY